MEKNLRQKQTNILKITTYGPESTGKTTLARDLANYFNTVWIVEFARDFLQEILEKEGRTCKERDLLPIAIGQTAIENEALNKANKYLFCDTNALVTKVYSDIYYNQCSPELEEAARLHHYDLYFLTDKDVPWEADGLRDSQEYRDNSFEIFKQNLITYNKPFIQISGNKQERLEKAAKIVIDLEKALKAGLTSLEFVELYNQNKNIDTIIHQINSVKKGIKKIHIEEHAAIGNGILKYTTTEFETYKTNFEENSKELTIEKFVPASGAASRMFKFLSDFLSDFDIENETINAYINRSKNRSLETFIIAMDKFPFFNEVCSYLKLKFENFNKFSRDKKNYWFIKTILEDKNFDYLNKPKAVLPFHTYENKVTTPIEEHFKEANEYLSNTEKASIHFTISKEHLTLFENEIHLINKRLNTSINYTYSFQDPTTDSVAVTKNDMLLKDNYDKISFRPGGHGALLYNLNNRNADILFIKNIDNVSHNNVETITFYKKALAGKLLDIQEKVFDYLNILENQNITSDKIEEIKNFIITQLHIKINLDFEDFKEQSQIKILQQFLNRPIRVCGMVKNENEPGGGPFWVKDNKGNITLQIVESAQIDLSNKLQKNIFNTSSHFNPVDLVCSIKNYKGEKFNLLEFTNPEAGFIVEKSKNGVSYKAYELPGLWNGSMANWITLFVEIPLETFNPVKTVNDLLKPAHQNHS
jgi:nicotinamide riboside kinase